MELSQILLPSVFRAMNKIENSSMKFAHYTSAETLYKIFDTEKFLLRDYRCMNDANEIQHGFDILKRLINEQSDFVDALKSTGVLDQNEIISLLNDVIKSTERGCFIASFSEHPKEEDEYGRLSMWRAYGGSSSPVAMIFDPTPFLSTTQFTSIISGPVEYGDRVSAKKLLDEIASNIQSYKECIQSIDKQNLEQVIKKMFLFAGTCFKHNAFKEEQEWRIICVPELFPNKAVKSHNCVLDSIPQITHTLPLKTYSDKFDIGLTAFLDLVLIGPSKFPDVVYDAIVANMDAKGFPDAAQKVHLTNIPLRTNM